jgi:hypothetical protein
MRDKIKEIVTKIFYSPASNGKWETSINSGTEEIEKYILSLLEEQKVKCADAVYDNDGVLVTDYVIKNTPLVVESDLVVIDKENLATMLKETWNECYLSFRYTVDLGEGGKFNEEQFDKYQKEWEAKVLSPIKGKE